MKGNVPFLCLLFTTLTANPQKKKKQFIAADEKRVTLFLSARECNVYQALLFLIEELRQLMPLSFHWRLLERPPARRANPPLLSAERDSVITPDLAAAAQCAGCSPEVWERKIRRCTQPKPQCLGARSRLSLLRYIRHRYAALIAIWLQGACTARATAAVFFFIIFLKHNKQGGCADLTVGDNAVIPFVASWFIWWLSSIEDLCRILPRILFFCCSSDKLGR